MNSVVHIEGVAQHGGFTDKVGFAGLRWLTLAQAAVILPHVSSLPVWLMLLVVVFNGWRWCSHQGYIPLPGAWLKALLLLGSILSFFVTYRGQFGVEAAVAFFTLAYALKVLEVQARRDLYLFIFLSFFLLAMTFLFDQSLLIVLYVVAAVWICLIGLSRIANPVSAEGSGYTVTKIMLQALPLMLIAYLMFPRIAPLWKVPMNVDQARTGISDRIKPGDIAELAQSGERAFRVTFEGEAPPQEELYWRGLSLDAYRNGEWRDSGASRVLRRSQDGEGVSGPTLASYEVIQEPTGKPWGFALQSPVKGEGSYQLTADGFVRFPSELRQPVRYSVGVAAEQTPQGLTRLDRHRYTALPGGGKPGNQSLDQPAQSAVSRTRSPGGKAYGPFQGTAVFLHSPPGEGRYRPRRSLPVSKSPRFLRPLRQRFHLCPAFGRHPRTHDCGLSGRRVESGWGLPDGTPV